MTTFITEGGEGLGKRNKKRTATKSKGSGLEDGASRALMTNSRDRRIQKVPCAALRGLRLQLLSRGAVKLGQRDVARPL